LRNEAVAHRQPASRAADHHDRQVVEPMRTHAHLVGQTTSESSSNDWPATAPGKACIARQSPATFSPYQRFTVVSSTTDPPCLGADGGVFIRAAPERSPVCTASVDASVVTFTFTGTRCTRLLGEVFLGTIPCDVSGIPAGTYDARRQTSTGS
jgi:hypothetical protein